MSSRAPKIVVNDMDIAYGDFVLQHGLDFAVGAGEVFMVMGRSGCGKSTLLKQMIGLKQPSKGDVSYDGVPFWAAEPEGRLAMLRHFGILYQGGALWSSMTLAENVALPLAEYTDLSPGDIHNLACLKLDLVGLEGFADYYPAQLSGGMRKRAGLARAMALDPDILLFDEPSAGLDPVSSRHLDDLILAIRDSLGTTIVVVSHELASIFAIADNSIFLDAESKTAIAGGNPRALLKNPPNEQVRDFLTRGGDERTVA
jgi:phospholipid/cholesterol/gamma-HCH transport system ATP-binding protein